MDYSKKLSEKSLVLRRDQSRTMTIEAVGVQINVLVTGEDSNGVYSLFEYTAPPDFSGPPLHWHKETAELFYMLEGSLMVRLDKDEHHLTIGDRVLIPPGTIHGFSNPAQEPARFLLHVTPGGFEQYFDELGEMIRNAPSWPPTDMSPVKELAAQFDTHHVAPDSQDE